MDDDLGGGGGCTSLPSAPPSLLPFPRFIARESGPGSRFGTVSPRPGPSAVTYPRAFSSGAPRRLRSVSNGSPGNGCRETKTPAKRSCGLSLAVSPKWETEELEERRGAFQKSVPRVLRVLRVLSGLSWTALELWKQSDHSTFRHLHKNDRSFIKTGCSVLFISLSFLS